MLAVPEYFNPNTIRAFYSNTVSLRSSPGQREDQEITYRGNYTIKTVASPQPSPHEFYTTPGALQQTLEMLPGVKNLEKHPKFSLWAISTRPDEDDPLMNQALRSEALTSS